MDAKLSKRRTAPSGFTLVELLVVIAIIAILAGLIIVGGAAAFRAAKRYLITQEIRQMQIALAEYKANCGGDYPPDCAGDLATDTSAQQAILRHLEKRFPNYQPERWDGLRLDVYNASAGLNETNADSIDPNSGLDLNDLDPSTAFFFFLGGPPDYNDNGKPLGFSMNPASPFARGGNRLPERFEFDPTRIVKLPVSSTNSTEVYKYIPKYIENPNDSGGVPYIYFRARSGEYTGSADIPGAGICLPFARTAGDWYKPKEFQIITAGLDGEFGGSSAVDSLDPKDDDNLTSFAEGPLANEAD